MIYRRFLAAIMLLSLSISSTSAAEIDDYAFWKTVEFVDAQCHYLKAVERRTIDELLVEVLNTVPQTQHFNSGRTSSDEYEAWLTGIETSAADEAARVGCTSAAEQLLLKGRGAASERIYQDLLLAFHFHGLPKEDSAHQLLAADQIQAATGYDQFLQQVYGANFQAFAAAQRERATQRLPQQSAGLGDIFDPYGIGVPEAGPDYEAAWELQSAVSQTVSDVLFEVSAEVAGYRVWPEPVGNNEVNALHANGSTELYAHIVAGPKRYDVAGSGKISVVLVRMVNGDLTLMSYGDEGKSPATAGAAVALLIRTAPLAEGQLASTAWSSEDWRSLTTRYDLTPVTSSCLGGACWQVPQTARDRLLEISAFEAVELWFAIDRSSGPEPVSNQYRRGGLPHFNLHLLEGRSLN